jgi:hypothetical protein
MAILGQTMGPVTTGAPGYGDFVAAGVFKVVEERLIAATPIGNGNLVSGALKIGAGYACHKLLDGGIVGNGTSIAFTVDGIEDVIQGFLGGGLGSLLSGFGIGGGNGNADASWVA